MLDRVGDQRDEKKSGPIAMLEIRKGLWMIPVRSLGYTSDEAAW